MSTQKFRANVGVLIARGDSVLAFQRKDYPDTWQFPQGGIDVGETPEQAAYRELQEETGLGTDSVELVSEYDGWLLYEYGNHATRPSEEVIGQAQKWFLFSFVGDESDIKIDNKEFIDWQWTNMTDLQQNVPPFKRDVYQRLGDWLAAY